MRANLLRKFWRYRHALAWGVGIGAVLGSRNMVESNMWQHMLLQFPLLIWAGYLLARHLPSSQLQSFSKMNQFGLTGLVFAVLTTAFWMIPAALDLAVDNDWIDLLKMLSLVASGMALRLSWHASGRALQAYFLISWSMMTVTIGLIFQDPSTRLCNYYRVDDQLIAGYGLVMIGIVVVMIWFWQTIAESLRLEQES